VKNPAHESELATEYSHQPKNPRVDCWNVEDRTAILRGILPKALARGLGVDKASQVITKYAVFI